MNNFATIVPLWENKEIKFDTINIHRSLRNGENGIHFIGEIEDSKGNIGITGCLLCTNLRLIWYSLIKKKNNLSIGYGTILNINSRIVSNKLRGNSWALYVLAIFNKRRFEFLFSDISNDLNRKQSPIFQNIFEIYNLYQRTNLYRDIRLRGSILLNGQLILLPREQVMNEINGVWNLSSDQGNLGIFIITNIRIVWYADSNNIFNISLPYIQIENICFRETKYGPALVINTAETGGAYTLGFRIDPIERLHEICQELLTLHNIYTKNPDFGIIIVTNNSSNGNIFINTNFIFKQSNMDETYTTIKDYKEIDEHQENEIHTKLNMYVAATDCLTISKDAQKLYREPVYCKELGFAMERIRDGYKLKDLWDVLPQEMILIEDE